jgi:hypothetical protein
MGSRSKSEARPWKRPESAMMERPTQKDNPE